MSPKVHYFSKVVVMLTIGIVEIWSIYLLMVTIDSTNKILNIGYDIGYKTNETQNQGGIKIW